MSSSIPLKPSEVTDHVEVEQRHLQTDEGNPDIICFGTFNLFKKLPLDLTISANNSLAILILLCSL